MTYRTPVVLDPRVASNLRWALKGTGMGFLGANSPEALQLMVGPHPSRAQAVMGLEWARGPVLDMQVTPQGVTAAEAGQLPDRIRAALADCGHYVEEAKWGGGSMRGKVYVKWRAAARVNAVQHMNEVAAILASVAPAFGPQARLTAQRMRANPGPFADNVYVYLEPAQGLPQVVCDAARATPIPTQAPRAFEPPSAPPAPRPTPTEPAAAPAPGKPAPTGRPGEEGIFKPAGEGGPNWLAIGAGTLLVLGIGFGAVALAGRRRRRPARNPRRRRRRRRRRR